MFAFFRNDVRVFVVCSAPEGAMDSNTCYLTALFRLLCIDFCGGRDNAASSFMVCLAICTPLVVGAIFFFLDPSRLPSVKISAPTVAEGLAWLYLLIILCYFMGRTCDVYRDNKLERVSCSQLYGGPVPETTTEPKDSQVSIV